LVGEAVKFGTHAVYNLGAGHGRDSFGKAFDDTGGLTFNLMNVATIAKMFGIENASDMNLGLFELQITKDGVSSRIGTGGIDVSGFLFDIGSFGVEWQERREIKRQTELAGRMAEVQFPQFTEAQMSQLIAALINGESLTNAQITMLKMSGLLVSLSEIVPNAAMGTAAHYAIFDNIIEDLRDQGYENVRFNRNAVDSEDQRIIFRRPDIAALKDDERSLWEIKPVTDNTGRAQLEEYVLLYQYDGTKRTTTGVNLFEGERIIDFPKAGEHAKLTYWFEGGGIIKYKIDDDLTQQREQVPSNAPSRHPEASYSLFPSSRGAPAPNGWYVIPFIFRFFNFAF
jgi:hypothetical protein